MIASPDSARIRLPCSTLVPSSRTTSGTFRFTSRAAATTPSAITSHLMMPPKMLTSTPSTLGSDEQQLEGRGDLLLGGAAADVEEVRRLAAVQLDDVHRRHREPGAVDHAADVAVELDVVEVVPAGLDLLRVLLVEVAQLDHLGLAVERVAVEVHLGVERDDVALGGHDQRVDLDQAGVALDDAVVDAAHELHRPADLLALQARARSASWRPW